MDEKKYCGICRRFIPDGVIDGVRIGYCAEYAARCSENCVCHPDITYRPIDTKNK